MPNNEIGEKYVEISQQTTVSAQLTAVTYLVHGHVHKAWHSLDPKFHWWVLWMLCSVEMEFQMLASFVTRPKTALLITGIIT